MKKRYVLLLCAAALSIGAACSSVSAHGVFIANRFDQKALALGEGPHSSRVSLSLSSSSSLYLSANISWKQRWTLISG